MFIAPAAAESTSAPLGAKPSLSHSAPKGANEFWSAFGAINIRPQRGPHRLSAHLAAEPHKTGGLGASYSI